MKPTCFPAIFTILVCSCLAACSGPDDGKPFFAYLAHTSPHWPLQAPQESIAGYKGVYDDGYDALWDKRLQNLKDLGLVGAEVEPFPSAPCSQAP